ncbi:unnamed protein product [Parajaminaea phylloscopi]
MHAESLFDSPVPTPSSSRACPTLPTTAMPDPPLPASAPQWKFETLCATVSDPDHPDQYGSSSVPIYQSTTFKGLPGSSSKASQEFDYSRSGNPTRTVLQQHLSKIQGCRHSFAVATGMACLDVIARRVRPGECIIAGDDIYGGTDRLLGLLGTNGGVKVHNINMSDVAALEAKVQSVVAAHRDHGGPRLAMVLIETPTNPLLRIADIRGCVKAVRALCPEDETIIVVDNTMMSPALMRPLDLGADIVYDSATKYLSGHHDLMAGVVATNRDDLAKSIAFTINSVGNGLSPFDSFLLLRGLKTLSIRIAAQQKSSQRIAEHLEHLGFKPNYPGLPSHPGHDVHFSQAKGAGAVISFRTGDVELSQRIVGTTRLWGVSVSFGCVNSLISLPCLMSHAAIDPKVRAERGFPDDIIRLCVGIEDVDDLIADLDEAFLASGAVVRGQDGTLSRTTSATASAVAATTVAPPSTLLVSAPGKVILFGEHAVVHGVTALAASVALRCYAYVQPRADGKLHLELPELGVTHDWQVQDLPWDAVSSSVDQSEGQLDARLLRRVIETVELKASQGERSHASCVAFIYLYMTLAGKTRHGQTFTFRSTLPISAGLGSSASYGACLASSLLYSHGHLEVPSASTSKDQLPNGHAALINKYAYLSEQVLHGNPSGVDNSVAVYGGCLAFTRARAPRNALSENSLRLLKGVDEKRLLLTNTGVPRDTKQLVAGVQAALDAKPEEVNGTFDSIQSIGDAAATLLSDGKDDNNDAELGHLMARNHELLRDLGVSHPALEAVRTTLEAVSPRLSTKLTGAGGGGCAVTLVPRGTDAEVVQRALDSVKRLPQVASIHETLVGGPGVSVLADWGVLRSSLVGKEGETGELTRELEAERFQRASAEELQAWLEDSCQGGWVRA